MPSKKQKAQIERHFGCCRLVWNLALAVKKQAWESNRIRLSKYDLSDQLVDLKLANEWLYDANAQSLQSVLFNLDNSYNAFLKAVVSQDSKRNLGIKVSDALKGVG